MASLYPLKQMPIFYAQYEVVPEVGSENFEVAGGAFVNCWVKENSESRAQKIATAEIKKAGWKILKVEEEWREVTEQFYSENADGLEHYKQALSDGECYVYHQWPVESQEEDNVH